ncbi:hypothetical protein CROQUDRAFT_49099 [Cronartium quercuum f. sp. fusiforme G11]|uniref:Glutamyl-tRNA(Gln) amidotransferase subunit A, mitochondrial n=1 Tax=Cronartium quercuum f. sp. fusiforme G11 TaxID=708437 RepID=A0A9P6NGK1_9BASI|nr:hypothetical protein CROQUDRAFT_49099 [Cronartium quercuum f. sp. fusiforme G11]
MDHSNAFITRFQPPICSSPTVPGPLHGLTLALKDIFCLKQHTNTCASKFLKNFKPTYDSTVTSKLKRSGVKIIGKTNMDEFSMGSSSTYSYFGNVINPNGFSSTEVSNHRSTGGSSGGSAAAVAAKLCDLAIGSDTGGSTRLPASYCGIIGLKPSYGVISRYGMVQYSHSLDCVGLMGRSIKLVQALFDTLVGHDPRDPTSVIMPTQSNDLKSIDLSDLRIGIPVEYFPNELEPEVVKGLREAAKWLQNRGAQLISVSLPSTAYCLGAYYVIASAEASSNLARYTGVHYGHREIEEKDVLKSGSSTNGEFVENRSNGFGDEVKRRILLGTYSLSATGMESYYLKSEKIRTKVKEEFDNVFEQVDLLLTPPTLSIAPELDTNINTTWQQDQLLVPASLAGLPALVVPVRSVGKWPIGIQLIGPWGSESRLFRVGKAVEEEKESKK